MVGETAIRGLTRPVGCAIHGNMAKRKTFDEQHSEIAALEQAPLTDNSRNLIKKHIQGRNSLLAARAIQAAVRLKLSDLENEITGCFHRFMENPVKNDKGCYAKIAVVKALLRMNLNCEDVFMVGVRHIQMEPAFGPPVDTAEMLRVHCGEALVQFNHPEMFRVLTRLLADKQIAPRRAAAKLLGMIGGETSEMLLRLKLFCDDKEIEVTGECMNSLMACAYESSLTLIKEYMDASDESIAMEAAMAVAQSSHPDAANTLIAAWENRFGIEPKKKLCLPIAITRNDTAVKFLLDAVDSAHIDVAAEALDALKIYKNDPGIVEEIKKIVRDRGNPKLISSIKEFGIQMNIR